MLCYGELWNENMYSIKSNKDVSSTQPYFYPPTADAVYPSWKKRIKTSISVTFSWVGYNTQNNVHNNTDIDPYMDFAILFIISIALHHHPRDLHSQFLFFFLVKPPFFPVAHLSPFFSHTDPKEKKTTTLTTTHNIPWSSSSSSLFIILGHKKYIKISLGSSTSYLNHKPWVYITSKSWKKMGKITLKGCLLVE